MVSGGCDFNSNTRFSPVQSRVTKSYSTFSSRHCSTSLPASVRRVLTRAKVFGGVLFHSSNARVRSSPPTAYASAPPAIRDATSPARAGRFCSSARSALGLVRFAQVAAQDGVDETGLRADSRRAWPAPPFRGRRRGRGCGRARKSGRGRAAADPAGRVSACGPGSCGRSASRGWPASGRRHRRVRGTGRGRRAKAARVASARSEQCFREFIAVTPSRQNSRRNFSWFLSVQQRLMMASMSSATRDKNRFL